MHKPGEEDAGPPFGCAQGRLSTAVAAATSAQDESCDYIKNFQLGRLASFKELLKPVNLAPLSADNSIDESILSIDSSDCGR